MYFLEFIRKIGAYFGVCHERLNPLELKVLNAVGEQLPQEYQSVYFEQVDLLCHIQRHWKGKEVCMYTKGQKERELLENINLPVSRDEVKLAVVTFLDKSSNKSYKATIWVVGGHVFMINFNNSPKGICLDEVVVDKVDIKYTLSEDNIKVTLEPLDASRLSGWLSEWRDAYSISNLKEPLSPQDRKQTLDNLDIDIKTLPADYLELISQTEGIRVDMCDVFGLLEVREVEVSGEEYTMIGEVVNSEDIHGAFLVRRGEIGGNVFFADYENGDVEPDILSNSIKKSVEAKIFNDQKVVH